jgi:hypothetical protein
MVTMEAPTLFDLEPEEIEWSPVYQAPWPYPARTALELTKEEWKSYRDSYRCRSCGRLMSRAPHSKGCGGVNEHGHFEVCDDCAKLDRHWGGQADGDERERLLASQRKHRAKYLVEVGS